MRRGLPLQTDAGHSQTTARRRRGNTQKQEHLPSVQPKVRFQKRLQETQGPSARSQRNGVRLLREGRQ